MKNYIENFEYNYLLLPIKEINSNEITFLNDGLPWEFYVPEIRKYIKYKNDVSDYKLDFDKIIKTSSPEYNSFNILENLEKEHLYIEFANLLSAKNKKEKTNSVNNIKNFINNYGYIFRFTQEELKNSYIVKPLSEIETEIKIFSLLLNMKNLIDSNLKVGDCIPPIENLNLIFAKFPILKVGCNYDFEKTTVINDNNMLQDVIKLFKILISTTTNNIVRNCTIKITYISEPIYTFKCNSLLEIMYLQFLTDISKSNVRIETCEYCGKYVELDANENPKHIYCKLTTEERDVYNKDRSPCATNANMARYRERKRKNK